MEYVIETENLTKQYGTTTVVDNVNLHVPKGKIYGLLGRNGAGKTTAMKMMLQLVYPTAGVIKLFGTGSKEHAQTSYKQIGSIIETPEMCIRDSLTERRFPKHGEPYHAKTPYAHARPYAPFTA